MTTALTPVEIMVTWKTSEDLDVQVEYSVNDVDFSDYRLFGRKYMKYHIDPVDECLNNNNHFYKEFCDVIFPGGRFMI